MFKYLENKISQDQLSIRPKASIQFESIDKKIIKKKETYILYLNQTTQTTQSIQTIQTTQTKNTMIFDTETSDFNGDILQISWYIIDSKNKIIERYNYYVKDRVSSKDSYQIHKISIEKLRSLGTDFSIVMDCFIKCLEKVDTVVGHNIGYDIRCVLKNLRKYDIVVYKSDPNSNTNVQIFDIFELKDLVCTKKLSGGKSLDKLYMELFNEKMIDAHNSLIDVKYTYRCYCRLLEIINKKFTNNENKFDLNNLA
jgi:DNA polymerase III epsilon subunit-like protein